MIWATSSTNLLVASKGAACPAPSSSMRSRAGDGQGERSDEPDHVSGTAGPVAADDRDIDGRKIRRRRVDADRVAEVRQGCFGVIPRRFRHSSGKASHALPPSR